MRGRAWRRSTPLRRQNRRWSRERRRRERSDGAPPCRRALRRPPCPALFQRHPATAPAAPPAQKPVGRRSAVVPRGAVARAGGGYRLTAASAVAVMPWASPRRSRPRRFSPGHRSRGLPATRPNAAHVITVYWLGLSPLAHGVTELVPACRSFGLSGRPTWARLLVVLSAVQMVYVLWMVSLPDFSTVWVVMLVYAAAACACVCSGLEPAAAARSGDAIRTQRGSAAGPPWWRRHAAAHAPGLVSLCPHEHPLAPGTPFNRESDLAVGAAPCFDCVVFQCAGY